MERLTIYQRLSRLFGPQSPRNVAAPSYNFDKKELLRTTSKKEFDKTKLQSQQSAYLTDQWTKIESQLYSQSVYYEPTRLASYYDYESMEFTPEISAALDIYAEESTTISERGFMLSIYSELLLPPYPLICPRRRLDCLRDPQIQNLRNTTEVYFEHLS